MKLLLFPIAPCALVEAIGDYLFALRRPTKSRARDISQLGLAAMIL
jgi:hypothetical protein